MRHSVIVLFALAVAVSRAQQIDLIQNPPARQHPALPNPPPPRGAGSLNGRWQTIMDPYQAGYYDFHLNPIKDGGLGANRVPANKGDKYELAFLPATPSLQVPSDWNTQKPELLWYEVEI